MADNETGTNETQKKSVVPPLVIPHNGIPMEVEAMFQKQLKTNPSRALMFENDKQRNIGILKKGIQKPGIVSFEVLRRAVAAVPEARICVTVLKEKVTKTEWVIKAKDPLAKVDEARIEEITQLLNNPNPEDSWRSFIDKLMEDLLILDVAVIEKTRFDSTGKLAGMYYVDASTIRPVYDEFGNQDIPVPLPNGETPPVSYVQIFNNSMYGGPESGEIVAAWAKKDMIRFMQHPQGSINNYGYGLSAVEGVLSVINNLLSADNFNGSYFDEGSLPPVIIHLAQSLEQRQLEAYREYMYGELSGYFHRPAIMAGGGELKIHNLKDMSNNDMQFMEYTLFLAKLMAAAFGLSPQDIGLTDDVNKSTSQTMEGLSNQKGYGSILHLIKEIVNKHIIDRDFGYTELEFDWVEEDSTDPDIASQIYERALKNGTLTVNEVREKMGETAFDDWADQPMILATDGYRPIHIDDRTEDTGDKEVANETIYREDVTKSVNKSVYTLSGFKTWFDDRGYGQPFIAQSILDGGGWVIKPPVAVNLYSQALEMELTQELASIGLNVKPVRKMLYTEIIAMFSMTDVGIEFDKYINMTPEYDSEKWRAKNGGSRKFPYYLVCDYIDGFALNSRQIIDDMKRDPVSYTQAVLDLASLWKAEKKMVLGDRRADQYIITPDKRAFGFDYQFKGDQKRWEDSSTAIMKVLVQIPSLHKLFMDAIAEKQVTKKSAIQTLYKKLLNSL